MNQSHMAAQSLINCHAQGLDSIVLKPAPQMVRIFLARADHELWKNDAKEEMSIGLHSHHCDVTIVPLFGDVFNLQESKGLFGVGERVELHRFKYTSAITSGAERFERIGLEGALSLILSPITLPRFLKADELHSIYVPKHTTAAWMICEGEESDSPSPYTFSNAALEYMNFDRLYQPMNIERLREDIAILSLNGIQI